MKESNTIKNMVMRYLFERCRSDKICNDIIFEKLLNNHFFE